VLEQGDVFGSTVHLANRMTSQAKASQIMTTAATVDELSPNLQAMTRQIDLTSVTGRREEVVLCEVLWLREDSTTMPAHHQPRRRRAHAAAPAHAALPQHRGDRERGAAEREHRPLGRQRPGRQGFAHLAACTRASSTAAASFMLVDLSTNGTCLVKQRRRGALRAPRQCADQGPRHDWPGRLAEANASHTIEYACEE
jgi:hypothetical protein